MIEVTAEQVERVERELAALPGAAARAMARALNRAASSARAEAVRAMRARYAAKAGDLRGMMTISSATAEEPAVTIRARSKSLSVGYFPHAPTKGGTGGKGKRPLRAEIKRGGRKTIKGAFVAELNSGPRVMIRTGQKTATGKSAIRSLYTIPLAQMLGVESVRLAVEQKAIETLDKRLQHEIDRELGAAR